MLHLPGLVMSDQMNKIINSVNKIGLAVRGLHGEGTEAMGNCFRFPTRLRSARRRTKSSSDSRKSLRPIIEHEQNARLLLLQRKPVALLDQIGRGYGVLLHAHSISSKEALNQLSVIKLGIDLGLFPEAHRLPVDELFFETQPAHLQKGVETQKMSAEERDALRAKLIRAKLKGVPEPDTTRLL